MCFSSTTFPNVPAQVNVNTGELTERLIEIVETQLCTLKR